jgi:predicted RNA binding protein YcfA (HicA-like mRNA interferase family)
VGYRLSIRDSPYTETNNVKFSELVRLLEENGFIVIKEKGSVRYYGKPGWNKLIRVDYHRSKEVPTGTCHAILKAAGIKK